MMGTMAGHRQKIAVLVVYFGHWPEYFRLFLKSCAQNPCIDFIFITDCGQLPADMRPPNCRLYPMTLGALNRQASERLGYRIDVARPYKLCDLRPVYGLIFEDLLNGYDFWGWCDLDIVFGDIRKFAHDEVLEACDVFSCNEYYVSGCFTLVRNTHLVETLVTDSRDFRMIAKDGNRNYCFDECAGCWNGLRRGKSILDMNPPTQSLTELLVLGERDGAVRWHRESLAVEHVKSSVTVDRGHVWMNGMEYLLFHHVCVKAGLLFTYPRWREVPETYVANRYGFFLSGEDMSAFASFRGSRLRPTLARIAERIKHKTGKGIQMMARGNVAGLVRHFLRRRLDRQPM